MLQTYSAVDDLGSRLGLAAHGGSRRGRMLRLGIQLEEAKLKPQNASRVGVARVTEEWANKCKVSAFVAGRKCLFNGSSGEGCGQTLQCAAYRSRHLSMVRTDTITSSSSGCCQTEVTFKCENSNQKMHSM